MCHNGPRSLPGTEDARPQGADQDVLRALESDLLDPRPGRDDVVSALGRLVNRAPRGQGWTFDQVASVTGLSLAEGRTFVLKASTAGVRISAPDQNRRERAHERERGRISRRADLRAAQGDDDLAPTGGAVVEWSKKSRARMAEKIAGLDYSPMESPTTTAGMVTLTYPGRWLEVAPTGKVVKGHLKAFRRRWARAFGAQPKGLWKLEFQRRGAPHLHLYLAIPATGPDGERFELWLSRIWAEIVDASSTCEVCGGDTLAGCCADAAHHATSERARHQVAGTAVDFAAASKASDARRLAIYFLKHGTKTLDDKEYQHVVPEAWREPGAGPGRFWGFWGLEHTGVEVHLDLHEYVAARRVLRKVLRARAWRIASARHHGQVDVPVRTPPTLHGSRGFDGGFVLVNDGVRLTLDLRRHLASLPLSTPGRSL